MRLETWGLKTDEPAKPLMSWVSIYLLFSEDFIFLVVDLAFGAVFVLEALASKTSIIFLPLL
jgi:hypothetical protein